MTTHKFKTNLNCGSCVAAVTPLLNGEKSIERWSVDTASPEKVLTVEGDHVTSKTVERLVSDAGFRVLGAIEDTPDRLVEPTKSFLATYRPILLVFGYLTGVVGLLEYTAGSFDALRAMGRFMGGFFLVFSFFKLLDLRGFVDAFTGYDLLARRVRAYGWGYPFIELGLGVAYTAGLSPLGTNIVTLLVMGIGTIGVVKALLEKRKIQCACLGAVLNLPMSYVTLGEDLLMAGMALAMLIGMPN